MDEKSDEEIEFILFSLLIYSKGALRWPELEEMPLSQVANFIEYADKLNSLKEENYRKEAKKAKR